MREHPKKQPQLCSFAGERRRERKERENETREKERKEREGRVWPRLSHTSDHTRKILEIKKNKMSIAEREREGCVDELSLYTLGL